MVARGPEAQVELYVCNLAKKHGWENRKVSWVGRRGAHDRVFFGHGRCVWIEFKKLGAEPEGQQAREIARLKALYPEIYVSDNVRDALRLLGIDS